VSGLFAPHGERGHLIGGNHFEGVAQALARVHTRGNLGAREIRPPFSDSVLHHIFFL
jgi:hypothetical protein